MAGKYGSVDITISLEDSPGGTARAIEGFSLEMGGVKITALTEESHTFGDAWVANVGTGLRRVEPLTITGFWDTTPTTGSHAVLQTPDYATGVPGGRELVVVFGDSKTFTADVALMSYEVLGSLGALTRFTAELLPAGAGVWT